MRVAIVSHTYVVAANRGKLDALAALPDVELLVIVPRRWRNSDIGQTLPAEASTGRYALAVVPAAPAGRSSVLCYSPWRTLLTLWRFRPDVVHVEEEPWTVAALELSVMSRLLGARFTFFTWQNIERRLPLPFRAIRRVVLSLADRAVAGNREAARLLDQQGMRGRVTVLPQIGIDADVVQPGVPRRSEPFVIGFIGRLVPQKGVDVLLRAAAQLSGDVRLLFVGSGPLSGEVRRQADALGFGGRFESLAQVPHAQVSEYFQRMDVVVLPSLTTPIWKEQFGHVLIEAMAFGVPIIGSDSGAIPEVVGDAGLIVKEADVDALAGALRRMQVDAALRESLARRGRSRALAEFSNPVVAKRLVAVWTDVAGGNAAPAYMVAG
jgi:glycosyltransferase involved in cell wall biosynthesis